MAEKDEWFEAERVQDLVDDSRTASWTTNCVWSDHGGEILLNRNLGALVFAVKFMVQVIRTKDVAFKIRARQDRKVAIAASPLAKGFGQLGGMMRLYSRSFHFSPHLRLLFDCFPQHEIRHCILRNPSFPFDNERIEAEVFNDFIAFVREMGARIGIVKHVNDWENASDGNEESVRRYIPALFELHASLVPVHIELFYEKSCVKLMQLHEVTKMIAREEAEDMACLYDGKTDMDDLPEVLTRYDVSGVIKDRDRLFDNMRSKRSIFGSMVGYVWRVDCTYSGYYLRVVFFFDGSMSTTGEWLGDQIGQYWVDRITDGRGRFRNLNCSSRKFGGDVDVFGKIDFGDTAKRERLTRFLCRLARRDRYVCMKPLSKCKRFDMGRPRKVKPVTSPPGKARTRTPKKSD